jgi:hypothetical protein
MFTQNDLDNAPQIDGTKTSVLFWLKILTELITLDLIAAETVADLPTGEVLELARVKANEALVKTDALSVAGHEQKE